MTYLIAFLLALLLSLFFTPVVKKIAIARGCVAKPREDRWHKKDTALFGGVAIFLSFVFTYLIFVEMNVQTIGIIVCGAFVFGLGLFDDIVHIKPYTKLVGQIIIASLLLTFGVGIKVIPYPFIAMPLTIFWVVAVMNAFNLLDNMDGLSGGIAAIVSGILVVYSFLSGSFIILLPALILAGSMLGFLRYNFNPARIFMGDSGSMFIGFMLATMTLEGSWHESTHLAMVIMIPFLTLAVPLIDTTFVTLVRRFTAHKVFQGGRDHISHRMVVLGLSEKNTVLVLYSISLIFGGISILSMFVRPMVTLVLLMLSAVALVYFANFLGKVKVYKDADVKTLKHKNGNVILSGAVMYKRRILEVAVDFTLICAAYIAAYLLRFEGMLAAENQDLIAKSLPLIVIIKYLVFFRFGLYRGIWRYVSIRDLINIFKAVTVASAISAVMVLFIWRFQGFSRAVFVIDWLLLFVFVSGSRILERIYKEIFDEVGLKGKRVLIYGAGNAGEFVLREIKNNRLLQYKPVGFLDDDEEKIGRRIHGIPVLGACKDIVKAVKQNDVQEIILAIPGLSKEIFENVEGFCRSLDITCRKMSDILPK
jgi:UDP-GlcNAc:undecaprenyl-phosphate/decaprenyl-phosphate GlcNAc-1-phosphate transferase